MKGSEKIMETHFLTVNMRNFRPKELKRFDLSSDLGVETKPPIPCLNTIIVVPPSSPVGH